MGTTTFHLDERRRFAEFASQYAELEYREPLAILYDFWDRVNREYFQEVMTRPHLMFGRTAPRSLAHCHRTTGYGGRLQITLNEGLVVVPNRDWVRQPWPADGLRRFVEDLLLRMTVRQYVLERCDADERGYRGYGPLFTGEANRIGLQLGLAPVAVRRRGQEEEPVCTGWPHCVRAPLYYGDAVSEALLDLATGGRSAGRQRPAPPSLGLLELLLYLIREQKIERVQELLIRHIDRLQQDRTRRRPVRRQVEEGFLDVDQKTRLGDVAVRAEWLSWNNSTVRKIAESIRDLRAFGDLPILADALEEAGCADARILRHLRERIEHTSRCWVLRKLLPGDPEAQVP